MEAMHCLGSHENPHCLSYLVFSYSFCIYICPQYSLPTQTYSYSQVSTLFCLTPALIIRTDSGYEVNVSLPLRDGSILTVPLKQVSDRLWLKFRHCAVCENFVGKYPVALTRSHLSESRVC
jgi:hypothetical protein